MAEDDWRRPERRIALGDLEGGGLGLSLETANSASTSRRVAAYTSGEGKIGVGEERSDRPAGTAVR